MHFMNLRAQEQENKHDYKLVSISHSAAFLRQWGGQMSGKPTIRPRASQQ
jgi:hypothetical protein